MTTHVYGYVKLRLLLKKGRNTFQCVSPIYVPAAKEKLYWKPKQNIRTIHEYFDCLLYI